MESIISWIEANQTIIISVTAFVVVEVLFRLIKSEKFKSVFRILDDILLAVGNAVGALAFIPVIPAAVKLVLQGIQRLLTAIASILDQAVPDRK